MQPHSMTSDKGKSLVRLSPAMASINDQQQDVEKLLHELKKLLMRYESALDREGIRPKVEKLEQWMESYRSGLAAAAKVSSTGVPWLTEFRDQLKMSADELHRLEGEGGSAAPPGEHTSEAEDLIKATRRIDQALPILEQLLDDLQSMK